MDLDISPEGSVAQFFNPVTLRVLKENYCVPPFWEGDVAYDPETGKPQGLIPLPNGPLKLWLHPQSETGGFPRARHGAGADISTGNGATNSCLSIISGDTGEKLLEYATPLLAPELFAVVCVACCWLFLDDYEQPPLFAWEDTGPGLICGTRIQELNYPCLWFRESGTGTTVHKTNPIPGWIANAKSKTHLLQEYRAALDLRHCINHSEPAIRECLQYRYSGTGSVEHPMDARGEDPTGARVNHGDRVIADALAWKMAKTFGMIGAALKKDAPARIKVNTLGWRLKLAEQEVDDPWGEPLRYR